MSSGKGIILLFLGIAFATSAEALATDWRFYAKSEFGLYQYDAEDVDPLFENLVRVRQRLVLSDRGATNLTRELGEEYQHTREIITLREIDCASKKGRILELVYRSEDGLVIKREFYGSTAWESIIPDSVDDILFHAICEQGCLPLTPKARI